MSLIQRHIRLVSKRYHTCSGGTVERVSASSRATMLRRSSSVKVFMENRSLSQKACEARRTRAAVVTSAPPLTPSKRDDFVKYFQHLIPIVGVQPGCVSANLLIGLDGYHAVNIGQFQTPQDFQAIFRKPHIIMGFAQGVLRRIVPGPPRLRQYDLVAASLYHNTQMEPTCEREHQC